MMFDPLDLDDIDSNADAWEKIFRDGSDHREHLDSASANYYVGRLKKNKEKAEAYEQQAKEMIDDFKVRVQNWLKTRQEALEYDNKHCMEMLEAFYESHKPENGKPISLPEGNVGFYTAREKYDFDTNEKEIIKLLEEDPDMKQFLRYKPEINRIEFKKACTVDGDQVYLHGKKVPVAFTPKSKVFGFK